MEEGMQHQQEKAQKTCEKTYTDWSEIQAATDTIATEKHYAARKHYFQEKPKFPEWRQAFHNDKIDELAKEDNTSRKVILARIQREKKSAEMGRQSRWITGKNIKAPVLKAITMNDQGEQIKLNTQENMVPVIAASNLLRQKQSEGSPFMTSPLLDDFGYLAEEEYAKQIIAGTYQIPEGTSSYAAEFIETLKMSDAVKDLGELTLNVTPQQNREGWKRMKDKSSSAHESLGFSHYRTAAYDDVLNEIDAFTRSAPLEIGFAPTAWGTITDLQILKKANNYLVDKMRCIQLMDAEYNMNNKLLGKRLLAHAEKAGAVSADQHGSRKNHKAQLAILIKQQLMDTLRVQHRCGAICWNRSINYVVGRSVLKSVL